MNLFFIRNVRGAIAICLFSATCAALAQSATNIVPRYGSPGDSIDIYGNGFNFSTKVRFGNGTSTAVLPAGASDIQLTGVIVPANATSGLLTLSKIGRAHV